MTVLLAAAFAALLSACAKSGADEGQTAEQEFFRFSAPTKAGGDPYTATTYYAALYLQSDVSTCYNGTYCDPKGDNDFCTPCKVSASGEWQEDGYAYGLFPSANASYHFVVASPALAPSEVTVGENKSYRYHLSREMQSDEIAYFSDPAIVSTNGILMSSNFIYPSVTLREHRSKLNFYVKCGDDVQTASFKAVELQNLITSTDYDILAADFVNSTATTGTLSVWSGNITKNQGDAPESVASDIFVLSRDYSRNNAPCMHFTRGDDQTYDSDLAFEMKPHYSYDIIITVNSMSVTISVTASAWDNVSESQNLGTYYVGTFTMTPSGWETGDPITGTIE